MQMKALRAVKDPTGKDSNSQRLEFINSITSKGRREPIRDK
jgi:hypothetical protein